tara:strand:+ start:6913 stop:8595 length:1683 start_codon:yes stop_codon:yes gene_type:complete
MMIWIKKILSKILSFSLKPENSQHLAHLFVLSWKKNFKKIAITESKDGQWTNISYGELGLAVHKVAGWLKNQIKKSEKRIGIFLPNSAGFIVSFFSCQILGKTAIPLNYALSPKEVKDVINDAQIKTLLTFEAPEGRATKIFGNTLDYLQKEIDDLKILKLNKPKTQKEIQKSSFLKNLPDPNPENIACYIYTSGSTGKPKGVMLSHGNLSNNLSDFWKVLGDTENHTISGVLPLFHSFGLTAGMLAGMLSGGRFVPIPAFQPKLVLDIIKSQKITVLELVPSMYNSLINAANRLKEPKKDLSSVRLAVAGGAPLPREIIEKFEKITKIPIYEGYGASETSPVISFNRPGKPPVFGTCGIAFPSVKIQLRDENNKEVTTALSPEDSSEPSIKPKANAEGEIWIKGPNVFKGYHGKEKETNEVLIDGWYRTGDIGKFDGEGNLTICGRAKHMIIVAGENVYPAEIEDAVMKHPKVKSVVAIGIPDKKTGEKVKAFIELENQKDNHEIKKEIISFLNEKKLLATYKMPKEIEILEEIPLLPTGKPDIPAIKGERDPIKNKNL